MPIPSSHMLTVSALGAAKLPQEKNYSFPKINQPPSCDKQGLCWQNLQIPLSENQNTNPPVMWSSSFDDVWMFPKGNHAFHFDGIEWQWSQIPTTSSIQAVWGEKPVSDRARNMRLLSKDGQIFILQNNSWQSIGVLRPPISMRSSNLSEEFADFHSLQGRNSSDLWAVGNYQDTKGIYHFDGSNWSFISANELGLKKINSVAGLWVGNTNVWTVVTTPSTTTTEQLILVFTWNGSVWKQVTDRVLTSLKIPFWQPASSKNIISGNSDNDIWLAGSTDLYHYDGTSWSQFPIKIPSILFIQDIIADQKQGIWVTTTALDRTTTCWHLNGTAWSNQLNNIQMKHFLTTSIEKDVWFIGKKNVNEAEETLFYWDGNQLHTHATNPFSYFDTAYNQQKSLHTSALFGTDEKNLWLLGTSNQPEQTRIMRWSADGNHIFFEAPIQLFAGWSSGPTDIWVGGASFALFHFDGNKWEEHPLQSSAYTDSYGKNGIEQVRLSSIQSIWGTAPNNVWAVGSRGEILHYDGQVWTIIQPNNQLYGLNKIWGLNQNQVWAVGTNGTILSFDGISWKKDPMFDRLRNPSYNFSNIQASQDKNGMITNLFLSGHEDYLFETTTQEGKSRITGYSKPFLFHGKQYFDGWKLPNDPFSWLQINLPLSLPFASSYYVAQTTIENSTHLWILANTDGSVFHYHNSNGSPTIWKNIGVTNMITTPSGIFMSGVNGALLFQKFSEKIASN